MQRLPIYAWTLHISLDNATLMCVYIWQQQLTHAWRLRWTMLQLHRTYLQPINIIANYCMASMSQVNSDLQVTCCMKSQTTEDHSEDGCYLARKRLHGRARQGSICNSPGILLKLCT